MFKTLIDVDMLSEGIDKEDWIIVDCRFSLDDTDAGHRSYQSSHIPGAVYAHLDQVLSNPSWVDNGRHPLPPPTVMISRFSQLGIDSHKQVVVYDNANGMIAARLWWMLRFMGHDAVAVLDGGWEAWQEVGFPVRSGEEENGLAQFAGSPQMAWLVLAEEVPDVAMLVDSRALERFQGEVELIDPVAGRIPGSVNYFYQRNWSDNGRYLPVGKLRKQMDVLVEQTKPSDIVFYCGSGVSACVNLLAMAHAGLGNGRLYAGSWSDWISNPNRPVEKDIL